MSSDPIEVLRKMRRRVEYRLREAFDAAESDAIRDQLAAIDAALASLSAPKPESAEAVAWAVKGPMGETAHMGSVEPNLTEPGWSARPLVYGDTSPPRPEASAPVGVEGPLSRLADRMRKSIEVDGTHYRHIDGMTVASWADQIKRALAQQPAADRETEFAAIADSADCPACGEAGPCECKGCAQQPAAQQGGPQE